MNSNKKPANSRNLAGCLARLAPIWGVFGGEEGIRTLVPDFSDHPISSRRRYDRFGTSPRLGCES